MVLPTLRRSLLAMLLGGAAFPALAQDTGTPPAEAAPAAAEESQAPVDPQGADEGTGAGSEITNEIAPGEWHGATSLVGEAKYAADFAHFDYVNPDAPKGGTLAQAAPGTYDSFNPFVVRGTAGAGVTNFGGLLYDALMESSLEESSTSYGLIAEAMRYPEDYSSVTFRLDPDAHWHDGEPITPEDVIWTVETLAEIDPFWMQYAQNVSGAEKTGEREVTISFDTTGNRELPHIMSQLPILPMHWWTGTGPNGQPRDISQPTTEPPLGSGPYRIARFQLGQSIVWERVEDYWGAENPTRVGRFNFGEINYTYFRDTNAEFEAFRRGGIEDYRVENRAARWAEGYDFPAVREGRVILDTFELDRIQLMQAYIFNARLPKFQDPRVREAFALALNFEEMNRQLFRNSYARTSSYFQNSELAATGLPGEAELEILEPLRGQIPDSVFTEEFVLPDYSERGSEREHLREANRLLTEAGYERRGTRLVNAETGEPLTVEFLGADPTAELVLSPLARTLERLGIGTRISIVDPTQYQERMRNFDFEMSTDRFAQSESPGNEQRDFWSSAAADVPGSRNTIGIRSEAVDSLIDDIIFAPDRESLVAASRALDRVLLHSHYVIPQWYAPELRVAYWSKLLLPEEQPGYVGIDPFSWWTEAAARDPQAAAAN